MGFLIDESDFFEDLGRYDWVIGGSLDDLLRLKKSPNYSQLRVWAEITKMDNTYAVKASLDAPDNEGIKKINYTTKRGTTKYEILCDIGRWIAILEAYFTGRTNDKQIIKIYQRYKIHITP